MSDLGLGLLCALQLAMKAAQREAELKEEQQKREARHAEWYKKQEKREQQLLEDKVRQMDDHKCLGTVGSDLNAACAICALTGCMRCWQ